MNADDLLPLQVREARNLYKAGRQILVGSGEALSDHAVLTIKLPCTSPPPGCRTIQS